MPVMVDSLASAIALGLSAPKADFREALQRLFGQRYHKRHAEETMFRDAYALAGEDGEAGVPWAGLINPETAQSGPYGGASVVWFPSKEHGSTVSFVVGTKGLSPDEGLLTRPGHRRRVAALRRYLARASDTPLARTSDLEPESLIAGRVCSGSDELPESVRYLRVAYSDRSPMPIELDDVRTAARLSPSTTGRV